MLTIGRVRNKLREVDPEYDYTIDICVQGFYHGFKESINDPENVQGFYHGFKESINDPENGFLQSSLLIKVCTIYLHEMKLISCVRHSSIFLCLLHPHMISPSLTVMKMI